MTTKYTPGPWHVGEKNIFREGGFKVYGYSISADGQAIARVHAGSVGKEAFSFGNQEANAQLIAAAPELHAALDKAERFIAGFEDDEMQEGINELLDEIRVALAAALGETLGEP